MTLALVFHGTWGWGQASPASPASAAPVASPSPSVAPAEDPEALIQQGIALREQGRDAEAYALFARAYAVQPTPRTRAQMGLAAQAAGHFVEGERCVREALASTSDRWIRQNRRALEGALAVARQRIGRILVSLDPPADGATVRFGEDAPLPLPLEQPVNADPGEVRVRVEARGHLPFETTVRVVSGEIAARPVTLVPVLPEPSRPRPVAEPTPAANRTRALATAGWVLLGTGAAAAATSVSLALAADRRAVEYNAAVSAGTCAGTDVDPVSGTALCRGLIDNVRTFRTAAIATGAVAGTVLVTSVALLAVSASQRSRTTITRLPVACGVSGAERAFAVGCAAEF